MTSGRFRTLAAGVVLLHVALLWFLLDRAMGDFLDVEETFVAFVAQQMIDGPAYPWTVYVYSPYEAGTLMVGLAVVPFFLLLGPSLLALKLVSVAISAVTVLLVILLGRRLHGPGCGLLAGLLLACGPPAWLIRGVQTLGDSSEVLPLVAAQWLMVLSIEDCRREGREPGWRLPLLGLLLGVGFSFSLTLAPSVGAMLLYWALTAEARPRWRELGLVVAGGLAGLALPLWNLVRHGVRFYEVRGLRPDEMMAVDGSRWWQAVQGWLGDEGLVGFVLNLDYGWLGNTPVHRLAQLYQLGMLACCLYLLARHREERSARVPALLYGAYLAAILTTPVRSPYLLLLLAPPGALMAGRCLQDLGRWASPSAAMLALALLLPFGGLTTRSGRPLFSAPASQTAWRWMWRLEPYDPQRQLAGEPGPTQLFGLGLWAATMNDRELDADGQRYHRGYGYALAWNEPSSWAEDVAEREAHQAWALSFGAGRCIGERHFAPHRPLDDELLDRLPEAHHAAFFEGLGFGYGWRFWHHPLRHRESFAVIDSEHWPHFKRGLLDRLTRLGARGRAGLLDRVRREGPSAAGRSVPATRLVEGNLNTESIEFGHQMAIDGGERPALAVYEVAVEREGRYVLWARYATGEPRPFTVRIGTSTRLRAPGRPTGGFHRRNLRWRRLGQFELDRGRHRLVLRALGPFVHLARLKLERVK